MRTNLIAVTAAGLLGVPALAQTHYAVLDLGTLSGSAGSAAANGLNDNAFVTGWSAAPASTALASSRRAFLYNPLSASPLPMRDLLPGVAGAATGEDVNNLNVAVGTIIGSNVGGQRGFVVGGLAAVVPPVQYINPLPGGNATTAADINDANWVVGASNLGPSSTNLGAVHAIAWHNNQTIDLGTLGGRNSQASAINNAGTIVGVSDMPLSGSTTTLVRRGFVHPGPGHSMTALSALTPTGSSRANDVSDTAIIVGASDWVSPSITPFSPPPTRAVMWTPASVSIINLGTLRNADRSSEALGVNSAGQVVGWSGTPRNAVAPSTGPAGPGAGYGTHAFIWEGGTMRDLNSLIPTSAGWVLHVATDINEHGQIVGWGTRVSFSATASSQVHAFLLTPMPTDACDAK